jgi:hypothetical protein
MRIKIRYLPRKSADGLENSLLEIQARRGVPYDALPSLKDELDAGRRRILRRLALGAGMVALYPVGKGLDWLAAQAYERDLAAYGSRLDRMVAEQELRFGSFVAGADPEATLREQVANMICQYNEGDSLTDEEKVGIYLKRLYALPRNRELTRDLKSARPGQKIDLTIIADRVTPGFGYDPMILFQQNGR